MPISSVISLSSEAPGKMLSRTPNAEYHIQKSGLRNLRASSALTAIKMINERELAINPIVQESVQHNTQVCCLLSPSPSLAIALRATDKHNIQTISNIRSLTASLFGVASGILGLESYHGFLFYLVGSFVVSVLIYALLAERRPRRYFSSPVQELWAGELVGGLSSFVLTWTLFYGLVRA